MDWNKEKTIYFIQLIKERPVIWNVSSSDHKIKNKKQDAIEEISNIFGITAKEVLAKWTSLRGQYNREKKKVTGLKTGSGAEDIYTSKWFAFEEMSNMLIFNTPQNTICNLENNLIPSPHSQSSLLATPTPPPPTPTPPPATPTPPPAPPTPPSATLTPPPLATPRSVPMALPPPSKFPKKRNRNTALYTEAMSTLKAIKQRQPSNTDSNDVDEISSFGIYVAAQLRKFTPIQQCKLKLDIQTLFYNYEVGLVGSSECKSTMSDYSDYNCEFQDSPMTPTATNFDDSLNHQPLNEVIRISNNGSIILDGGGVGVAANNSADLPAVYILDNKTVRNATEQSDQETDEAIKNLLKFNKYLYE